MTTPRLMTNAASCPPYALFSKPSSIWVSQGMVRYWLMPYPAVFPCLYAASCSLRKAMLYLGISRSGPILVDAVSRWFFHAIMPPCQKSKKKLSLSLSRLRRKDPAVECAVLVKQYGEMHPHRGLLIRNAKSFKQSSAEPTNRRPRQPSPAGAGAWAQRRRSASWPWAWSQYRWTRGRRMSTRSA